MGRPIAVPTPHTLHDSPVPRVGADLATLARSVAEDAAERASDHDRDGGFPDDEIEALRSSGLLSAPFPVRLGGHGLGDDDPDECRRVLVAIGRGSLVLGRLYEGHVNAVGLVARYGTAANLRLLQLEAEAGPAERRLDGRRAASARAQRRRLHPPGKEDPVLRGGALPPPAGGGRFRGRLRDGHTARRRARPRRLRRLDRARHARDGDGHRRLHWDRRRRGRDRRPARRLPSLALFPRRRVARHRRAARRARSHPRSLSPPARPEPAPRSPAPARPVRRGR